MTQPKALYLADVLDYIPDTINKAAGAELRRLHAVNAALREALHYMDIDCGYLYHRKEETHKLSDPCPVAERIRAAIKAAEGNT